LIIETTRFSKIEINKEEIIYFPEGIIGFSNFKHYFIVEREEDKPFKWLQSLDNSDLAFVIVNPLFFYPCYKVKISSKDSTLLKLKDEKEGKVFVLVVIPEDPSYTRANLLAPLVINATKKIGKQIILEDSGYPLQYELLKK